MGSAWSLEAAPLDAVQAEAKADRTLQLEVNTSALPRLDQDSGAQGQRVGMQLMPAGGSGLGVAVGLRGSAPRAAQLPSGYVAVRPGVDLGLTFRHAGEGQQQIDVSAWRRVSNDDDAYTLVQMREPVYGARVEMKLTRTRKAGFNVERGFIGMQLESGAKISIKRKNGGPMVYYRTAF